jgi:single-stranded-DNA-specific exonuclease
LLSNRGFFPSPALTEFCNPSRDKLPSPAIIKGVELGTELFLSTLRKGDRIGIVGDYDVDGITATAQMVLFLEEHGGDSVWHIPVRATDGYGISPRIVEHLIQQRCSLVVLLDHGTTSHREVGILQAAGIRVIAIDHHQFGGQPAPNLLINPAQVGCPMGSHFPCASALTMFFLWHAAKREPSLALAAVGTVADMVPLVGTNRIIAANGIQELRQNPSIGIRQLAFQLGVDIQSLRAEDIGFYLGPAINAAGRLADAREAVELLITRDEDHAARIARDLASLNSARKTLQRELIDQALARMPSDRSQMPAALLDVSPSNHQGVVGLIAQALASRYARPTFVLAEAEDGYRGSARSGGPEYDLGEIFNRLRDSNAHEYITKLGGHRAAGGISLKGEGLTVFTREWNDAVTQSVLNKPRDRYMHADFSISLSGLKHHLISDLGERLGPTGQGVEPLKVYISGLTVESVEQREGMRLILEVSQGRTRRTAYLGPEVADDRIKVGDRINVIATPISVYSNRRQMIQLGIRAFEHSSALRV